ncbi:MAG: RNA-guided pseudouridylation complex pseudouridine synthase subunit Cbf5 [Candidatus Woesearchaeota archaeon]
MNRLPFEQEKREILVKREAKTDPRFGCVPELRPVEHIINYGIVNINKPKGPTSHEVSEYVKRILGISKAGHSGTLDPAVTGVLPIALGSATKVTSTLLKAGKEYVALAHFHKEMPQSELRRAFESFVGKIKQIPPVRAAIKRVERQRMVYYLDILEIEGKDVLFRIGCEAGTYIRKLIHDIGQSLGVGAHMTQLIRTRVGPFTDSTMITLQDLEDALWYWKHEKNEKFIRYCIRPVEEAVVHLPKIWLVDSAIDSVCRGALLNVPGVSMLESGIAIGDIVALQSLKGELVAIAKATMFSQQIMTAVKGTVAKTERVFMPPGTYPKSQ